MQDIAGFIDHTLLRPDATAHAIAQLCAEARQYSFHAVCVNGCWVELARHHLEGTEVQVGTVVGFPLGAMDADAKRYETEAAIDAMAQEIDMVLNIGQLKDGNSKFVLREIRDVVDAADERPVKVIVETCLLTKEEKLLACELVLESGAKFVQTSTGFSSGGATVEDVRLLREAVGEKFGVKAGGGIRDAQTALAIIEAGATRLGSSHGVAIAESVIAANAGSN